MPELLGAALAGKDFYLPSGQKCSPTAWAEAIEGGVDIVGTEMIDVDGVPARVFTRFAGVDHDGTGTIWELGVTGSKYGGHHELYRTRAEAEAGHATVAGNLTAGKAPDG